MEKDFYEESKRLRGEVMRLADKLKNNPIRFTITNGITMKMEITKSDLKTIVSNIKKEKPLN